MMMLCSFIPAITADTDQLISDACDLGLQFANRDSERVSG